MNIKKIVARCVRQTGTRDPFLMAERLGILYQICHLNIDGCYMYLKKHRYIFINQDLPDQDMRLVMAHEIGHAIMHRKENCYFLRNKTLLCTDRLENEANTFAAELLVPDSVIYENPGMTKGQIARLVGYNSAIMDFKNFETCKNLNLHNN